MIHGSTVRGALGVAACVLLVACSSKADRIESGLRKGADYVRQSDWTKASIEARNVLQIDPKNARAYLIAAQVDDGKAVFRGAFANYSKAVELQPDLLDAKIGLARLYLLAGELAKAEAQIGEILTADADNPQGRTLKVAALARRGHVPEALAEAERLIAATPKLPVDSSLMLAGLYVNADNHAAALRLLDTALATQSANVLLLQMAAEVAGAPKAPTALAGSAVGYYKAATAAAPKNAGLWKSWALLHIRRNESAQAEAVLRDAVHAQPDDNTRTLALLEFVAAFRSAEVAEKEYAAAIAAQPKEAALRFSLVDYYTTRSRGDDARRVLQDIVALGKDLPSGLSARSQLAGLSLSAGRADEARANVDEVLKANPRDGAGLLLHGRIALGEGRARDAINDFRAAAKDQPGSAEVAGLLASAHHANSEPQLARDVITDAVKFQPADPRLHLLLASDMATAKEFKAASLEADEVIRLEPKSLRAHEMKGEYALAQGDMAGAERAAQLLQARFPTSPLGALQMGRLYATQKKLDAALKQYDAAAQLAPAAPAPALASVGLLVSQHKYADADKRIDALEAAQPEAALPHQLRAEVALAKDDLAAAELSFQKALAVKPVSADAYRNLASVMVARKNLAGALAVMDQADKAYPRNATLTDARASWLARAGRTDEAIAVYEAALLRLPDSDLIANNLAYVLAQVKGDPTSLARALQVASRFDTSNNPAFGGTLGLVRYRLGQYDKAVDVLSRAVALAPNEPVLQLHYGMALFKKGDVQQGREFLRKAFDSKMAMPNLSEARSLVARS